MSQADEINRSVEGVKRAIPEYPNFILFCASETGGFASLNAISDYGLSGLADVVKDAMVATPELLAVFRSILEEIDVDKSDGDKASLN